MLAIRRITCRPGSEQFLGNAGDMQMKAENTLFEHVGPIAGFVLVPLIAAHRLREPVLQTARQSKALSKGGRKWGVIKVLAVAARHGAEPPSI
jgi:hypothetical protein